MTPKRYFAPVECVAYVTIAEYFTLQDILKLLGDESTSPAFALMDIIASHWCKTTGVLVDFDNVKILDDTLIFEVYISCDELESEYFDTPEAAKEAALRYAKSVCEQYNTTKYNAEWDDFKISEEHFEEL